ncbi:hypothetical protein BD779DRAFT_913025 [Infundibulicybe gibba]|nr:hypothetical protein BD779DRAFT_913025 [Infundibulicybe gibba]
MVISRVGELSSLLSEAYKVQADLEVQLNVAKSNLQLVISNNEMLEEALKRDNSGRSKDVGWRRWSAREGEYREQRVSEERMQQAEAVSSNPEEVQSGATTPNSAVASPSLPPAPAPAPAPTPAPQDNRFFKFRFSNSTTNLSRSSSRSGTPSGVHSPSGSGSQNPASPSIPSQNPRPTRTSKTSLRLCKRSARQERSQPTRKRRLRQNSNPSHKHCLKRQIKWWRRSASNGPRRRRN